MAQNSTPLEAPNVRGVVSKGGFGGKGNGRKSMLKSTAKSLAPVLQQEGVLRVDNVLKDEIADELRVFVYQLRSESEELVKSGQVQPLERFANVLLKENRCDLTMPLNSPLVAKALSNILTESPIGGLISSLLGQDAVLYELSCLISDPGSHRQVVHPDTPFREESVLYTCFVALQDIQMDMGPTTWLPGTNQKAAHDQFQQDHNDNAEQDSPKDALLKSTPAVLGLLPKGSCGIFDSRTLHCGGANRSDQGRALFYFSFRSPTVLNVGNPGSIRKDYVGKYSLSRLESELKRFGKGKPSIFDEHNT